MPNNDPLSPVVRGDVLAITAAAWNEVTAAAKDRRQPARPDAAPAVRKQWGCVEALALNSTGADLREHKPAAVTGVGGYTLTGDSGEHWQRTPLLTLGVPAATTDFVVVTLEAIPDGAIGRVAVAGVCLCDVQVGSTSHPFANPIAASAAKLLSAASGQVRLVKAPSSGSSVRCVVDLDGQPPVPAADPDASPAVRGYVSTGAQAFGGVKRFQDGLTVATTAAFPALTITPTGVAVTSVTQAGTALQGAMRYETVVQDNTGTAHAQAVTGWGAGQPGGSAYLYGSFASIGANGTATDDTQGVGFYLGGTYDIYISRAEWGAITGNSWPGTTGRSGPVRHRQNSYVADGKYWGATRSGTDYTGVDAVTYGGTFKGGVLVDTTATALPPPPPPPPLAAGSVGPTELASTAVTPGSYTLTNLTVDSDGRITAAASGNASPALTGTPTAPTAGAGTNTTQIATTAFVAAAVTAAVAGLLNFKGATDCSANPNYPAAVKGDSYIVSVAGKIGGASGTSVEVGDWYVATANNAGGTEASVGSSWGHMEHNLVGALLASNNLSDLANATTARSNLGVAIGSQVQAYTANLDTFAQLTPSTDDFTQYIGSAWVRKSPTQVTAALNAFVASGASHLKGLVPDPGSTAGTTKFLREDATWTVPGLTSGTVGPTSDQALSAASGTFVDLTSATYTIPAGGGGDYEVSCVVRGVVNNTTAGAYITGQIVVNGTLIGGTQAIVAYGSTAGTTYVGQSPSLKQRLTLAAGDVIKVQVARVGTGTWAASTVSSDTLGRSGLYYQRVGP